MTLTIAQLDEEIAITRRDLAQLIQQRRQLTRQAKAPNLTPGHKAAGIVDALKAGQLKAVGTCAAGGHDLSPGEHPPHLDVRGGPGGAREPGRLSTSGAEGVIVTKPLAVDLFCGLGGWTEGLLAAGYDVVGFDITRHSVEVERFARQCGDGWETASTVPQYYPAQLVMQDILTVHGSQFRDAALIVASPPCQAYSYLAMPWSKSADPENSKAAKALRKKWETEGPDNRLFDACFRIQREAIEATQKTCLLCLGTGIDDCGYTCSECCGSGWTERRYIPLIVENVRGAQPWVGKSKAAYGSFHLWGDVEQVGNRIYVAGAARFAGEGLLVPGRGGKRNPDGTDHPQGSWFAVADSVNRGGQKTVGDANKRDGHSHTRHLTNQAESEGVKVSGDWFGKYADMKAAGTISPTRLTGKGTNARKQASAMIAKIPRPLSEYVARALWPSEHKVAQPAQTIV